MLQLNNLTPFKAGLVLFPDVDGVDSLIVAVKATFDIGARWVLSEKQEDTLPIDVYWGEPGKSSLRTPADFHLPKPFTDIVVQGNAVAGENTAVKQLDLEVSAGVIGKTTRVFGNRYWDKGRISSPEVFDHMPLVYERAFGGTLLDEAGEILDADPRNPVGLGFGLKEVVPENGAPLPNLEDPANLIVDPRSSPDPSCMGFIAPYWMPRSQFAGTYDARWKKNRAPYLPEDFDLRFFNMAHPDLVYPGYMQGGEAFRITNMHPAGDVVFDLPVIKLAGSVNRSSQSEALRFNLETVLIKPNDLQLSLTWRGKFRGGKKVREIDTVNVSLTR